MTLSQTAAFLPFWLTCTLAFVLGACVGSFLNVIIYRIPIGPSKRAQGMAFNINTPRSHCPICKHQLAWYENIPLVSWIVQAAKCKNCKITIPARYPAIELLVASIGSAAWLATSSVEGTIIAMTLSMALVPTVWWLTTRTSWNRPMLSWLLILLLVSIVIGGYAWTIN